MNAKRIDELIEKLDYLKLNPRIFKNSEYYDEPRFFCFASILKLKRHNTHGHLDEEPPRGSGTSFSSPEEALAKSLYEAMERFCAKSYKKGAILHQNYSNSYSSFIDPAQFSQSTNIREKKIGWVLGRNAHTGKKLYIPAQLVFLNYIREKNEPVLDYPLNSNGSAAGKNHEHALLNGIYEIIERDAFMSIYLNRITPQRVDLSRINDKRIKNITDRVSRYNLELYVLNITTDINIPSFLSVIIDKSRIGPAVVVGAKTNPNYIEAIISSISEALMCRVFVRNLIKDGLSGNLNRELALFANRAKEWVSQEAIKKIQFLVSGPLVGYQKRREPKDIKKELKQVLRIFQEQKLDIFYVDYTQEEFKTLGFVAYKVIIPGLQPLYLSENEKYTVNIKRIKKVSSFFGKEFKNINSVPHPFL